MNAVCNFLSSRGAKEDVLLVMFLILGLTGNLFFFSHYLTCQGKFVNGICTSVRVIFKLNFLTLDSCYCYSEKLKVC